MNAKSSNHNIYGLPYSDPLLSEKPIIQCAFYSQFLSNHFHEWKIQEQVLRCSEIIATLKSLEYLSQNKVTNNNIFIPYGRIQPIGFISFPAVKIINPD